MATECYLNYNYLKIRVSLAYTSTTLNVFYKYTDV